MSQKLTAFAVFLLLVVSFGLYHIKYEVEGQRERLNALSAQQKKENAAIGVLKPEWAYLTRPQRLQILTERFLPLREIELSQIGDVEAFDLRKLDNVTPPVVVTPPLPRNRPLQVTSANPESAP